MNQRIVTRTHLSEGWRELIHDAILIKQLPVVALIVVVVNVLLHGLRQLTISHVLTNLLQLHKSTF